MSRRFKPGRSRSDHCDLFIFFRYFGHRQPVEVDLVGGKPAKKGKSLPPKYRHPDDPSLTCRLAGMEDRSPVRVVADSHGRLPHSLKLFTGGGPPTWRIAGSSAAAAPNGIQHVETPLGANGQIDVEAGLRALAKRGITRLLVEGGGSLAASLIRAELVDRIELFQAPAVIGGDGLPGIAGLGIGRIDEIRRFSLLESRVLGDDMLSIYEPKRE